MVMKGCRLLGVGSSAPTNVISNADLERWIDTNDEWITTRTGIKRRHVLAEGETMAQHAATASARALDMAGVLPEDVDMILLATSTPDDAFGSACQVYARCCCWWWCVVLCCVVFGCRVWLCAACKL
jgi:3-oxoacyl-[acyl-carrier-protein] synthase-3